MMCGCMVNWNRPPLGVGRVELVAPDRQHAARRRVGADRRVAVHAEVRRIVADPLHRHLDHAGRLAVVERSRSGSSSAISDESYSRPSSRMMRSVASLKSHDGVRMPTGRMPTQLLERVGGAERQLALDGRRRAACCARGSSRGCPARGRPRRSRATSSGCSRAETAGMKNVARHVVLECSRRMIRGAPTREPNSPWLSLPGWSPRRAAGSSRGPSRTTALPPRARRPATQRA